MTTPTNKTARAQELVRQIRALDNNAHLDGITHNIPELTEILDYLIADADEDELDTGFEDSDRFEHERAHAPGMI